MNREWGFSRFAWIVAFALAFGGVACSSARKTEGFHEFDRVVAEPMRVRRPAGPGADPSVGPGEPDYLGHPLPNEKFDCEPPSSLFTFERVTEIRRCIESVREPLALTYRLRRNPIPELTLSFPESGSDAYRGLPECVRKSMERFPVPREVFFLAEAEGFNEYHCFSARTDVEGDTPLGVRLPIRRWEMKVTLPLAVPAPDDAAMLRLLTAWVLTPVLKPEGESSLLIRGRAVPESICAACFQGASIPERRFPYPPMWP